MAELVEGRLHLVVGQQRRFAGGRLGNVEVVGHHRVGAQQLRLRHISVHPGAALLVAAGVHVGDEDGQLLAVGVEHVEHAHVRVVHGQVLALLERQAVQLSGRVEHALGHHIVEFEVRLELVLVEREALRAQLVRVVGPVGRVHLEVGAFPVGQRLQVGRFLARIVDGRLGQLAQQRVDGGGGLGRLVLQRVGGEVGIAQQGGLVGAGLGDLEHDVAAVELAAMAATGQRGGHQAFAHGAVAQHGQRRLAGSVGDGDQELAVHALGLGGSGGRVDGRVRHTGHLGAGIDHQGRGVGFLQHVLGEGRLQGGDVGVDGFQFFLVGGRQLGAGTHEIGVVAFQQVLRFPVQVQLVALGVQGVDAGEQLGVQEDGVAMGGQLGRHVAVNGVERIVGVGALQVLERGLHAGQQLARTLHGHDGVVEGGRLGVVGDGVDFLQLHAHALGEGGCEMLVLDLVEGRVFERQRAGLEEGIAGQRCGGGGGRCGRCGVGKLGHSQAKAGHQYEHLRTGHVFIFQRTPRDADAGSAAWKRQMIAGRHGAVIRKQCCTARKHGGSATIDIHLQSDNYFSSASPALWAAAARPAPSARTIRFIRFITLSAKA